LKIRVLESRDVEAVVAIQSECSEIAQWTLSDYNRVASGEMGGWVGDKAGEIAGFLVARRVGPDAEVLNFAVRRLERQKGIGSALLAEALAWAKSFHAQNALLEVRVSNVSALDFYRHRGFAVAGRRPNYYSAPIEDALLLTAPLF
jgi:[ribosomal protein S18]-alanine N-acetyltransferase